jgi:dihydrofolate reductase
MHGDGGGATGVDDDFAARGFRSIGAWILGRNMFGPIRWPWPDGAWKGWWGSNPPYHVPVFALTHHPREPLVMEGGTTFHFVCDGVHAALARAREAAQGRDVRVGGGPATVRQYLAEGLVDELHLAQSPALLGRGEPLLARLDLRVLGYECRALKESRRSWWWSAPGSTCTGPRCPSRSRRHSQGSVPGRPRCTAACTNRCGRSTADC